MVEGSRAKAGTQPGDSGDEETAVWPVAVGSAVGDKGMLVQ